MPKTRDVTMIKADALKVKLALAEKRWTVGVAAKEAEVSQTIVTNMAAGRFVKPKYFGLVANALGKTVESLIDMSGMTGDSHES